MKIVLGAIGAVLFVGDFLALDDITTGNEPSFWQEYTALALSVVYFAWFGWLLKRRTRSA